MSSINKTTRACFPKDTIYDFADFVVPIHTNFNNRNEVLDMIIYFRSRHFQLEVNGRVFFMTQYGEDEDPDDFDRIMNEDPIYTFRKHFLLNPIIVNYNGFFLYEEMLQNNFPLEEDEEEDE